MNEHPDQFEQEENTEAIIAKMQALQEKTDHDLWWQEDDSRPDSEPSYQAERK
jgi:hypothetical protein